MLMRRPGEFEGNFKPTLIGQKPTEEQEKEIDRARSERLIRIRHIDCASRHAPDFDRLSGWFCLTVKDGHEFDVENLLDVSDIEACVPKYQSAPKRQRHRQTAATMLPVISGYVLVKCVRQISVIPGLAASINIESKRKLVTGYLRHGPVAYCIPDKYIMPFKLMADAGKFDYRPVRHDFREGETVRVTNGPFGSVTATIVSLEQASKSGRINVRMKVFGCERKVEMHIAQIEKI